MFYNVNFRCYYSSGNHTDHRQYISVADIPKWVECYRFTHPACISISIKIWFT